MNRLPLFRVLSVLSLLLVFSVPAAAERVARVIDGDTIQLASGERVRYIGIDTPETVDPRKPIQFMGKEAFEFNRGLVERKEVRLEYDVERKDKYGRTLAYVYVDTLFVNAELVRHGFAQILTIPPNVKHAELFLRLQQEAREAGRGLWDEGAAERWNAKSQQPDPETVYVTRTGKKYHADGCRYLARSKYPMSLAEAIAAGYGACSVCIGARSSLPRVGPGAEPSPGRCQAITKKGTQCKRNAKSGSRYCWQHGG
jgi:micrococcal nuclease